MTKPVRRTIARLFRKLGYVVEPVKQVRLQQIEFKHHIKEFFETHDISSVLDVGANIGQYRDFLRDEVEFRGPIVSFEPVRRNVEVLVERAASDPNWRVLDYALGNADEERALNVMASNTFSSFLDPDGSAIDTFSDSNVVRHRETVRIRRLDDVFDDLKREHDLRNVFMKLDTQGYDLEVMKGAGRTLPEVRGLQTEASVKPIYRGMPDYRTAIREFNRAGFEVTGMFTVSRDRHLRLVEFDCVMVNSRNWSGG